MAEETKKLMISVVMGVYNGELYLADTINSVLEQTFKDFEFVIVNDGSTDNTQLILDEYKRRDERIRIINNERNIGLTKSLNRGVWESQGKYIARIDVGDTCHKERFEKQIAFMEKNDTVGVVGSWGLFIDKQGEHIYIFKPPTDKDLIKKQLLSKSVLLHPSAMIKRDILMAVGGYNEKYYTGQEQELWIRMSKICDLANIPEVLVHCKYFQKESISVRKNNRQIIDSARLVIREVMNGSYSPIHLLRLLRVLTLAIPSGIRTRIRFRKLENDNK